MPANEFLKFASQKLLKPVNGAMWDAPLPKVRDFARLLYKSYVVSTMIRVRPSYIAMKLDGSGVIEKYLTKLVNLNKEYDVYFDTVSEDMSDKWVDSEIKRVSLDSYKKILGSMVDDAAGFTLTPPTKTRAKPLAAGIKSRGVAPGRGKTPPPKNTIVRAPVGKNQVIRATTQAARAFGAKLKIPVAPLPAVARAPPPGKRVVAPKRTVLPPGVRPPSKVAPKVPPPGKGKTKIPPK